MLPRLANTCLCQIKAELFVPVEKLYLNYECQIHSKSSMNVIII